MLTADRATDGCILRFSLCEAVDKDGDTVPISERPESLKDVFEAPIYAMDNYPSMGFGFLDRNLAVSTGNLFFSKHLLRELGGFSDYKYIHDWDFVIRALWFCEPELVVGTRYKYRLHNTNSFSSLSNIGEVEVDELTANFIRRASAGRAAPNPKFPCHANWKEVFDDACNRSYLLVRAKSLPKNLAET